MVDNKLNTSVTTVIQIAAPDQNSAKKSPLLPNSNDSQSVKNQTSSSPQSSSPIRKSGYNREKYLAEEFRLGGEAPSGGQALASKQELNSLLSRIKQEINSTG